MANRKNIPVKQREQIFLKSHGKCIDCGAICSGGWRVYKPQVKHFDLNGTHEIHHVIPVTRGGNNSNDNLILLCIPCHLSRHKTGVHHG